MINIKVKLAYNLSRKTDGNMLSIQLDDEAIVQGLIKYLERISENEFKEVS
jgi:hypothetical protein